MTPKRQLSLQSTPEMTVEELRAEGPLARDARVSHEDEVDSAIVSIIARAHWQSAKSVEEVAPHQYVVKGWDKDDLTEDEFWLFVQTIKRLGRVETWTAPAGFYDSGKRPTYRNRYLYLGNGPDRYAYWFTWPKKSVPMLNREHVSVQSERPTRRVLAAPKP